MIGNKGLDVRWIDKGACIPRSDLPWIDDLWLLPRPVEIEATEQMAKVCAACPVLTQCSAVAVRMTAGFWAGRNRLHDTSAHKASATRSTRARFTQPAIKATSKPTATTATSAADAA